jgi:hypothetical protein
MTEFVTSQIGVTQEGDEMMHVAVGRLQMTMRWMPRTEMPKPKVGSITNRAVRDHERERRMRAIDVDKARWESQSRRLPW